MVIFYEDILADPEAVCKRLFEVCGTSPECLPLALEALKSDAQGGLFAQRGKKPSAPKDDVDSADALFAACHLPITCGMSTKEFKRLILTGTYTNI